MKETLTEIRHRLTNVISLLLVMSDLARFHHYESELEHYQRVVSILQQVHQSLSPRETQTAQSLSKAINDVLLAVRIIQDNKLPIDWQPLYDLLPPIREIRGEFSDDPAG